MNSFRYSRFTYLIPAAAVLLFLFAGCIPKLDEPELQSGTADFTKVVALGDNYFSGYRDGALYAEGQNASVSAIVQKQMSLVTPSEFNVAALPEGQDVGTNVKPWVSIFQTRSFLGDKVDCEGETSLSPLSDSIPFATGLNMLAPYSGAVVQNIGVPSAATSDMLSTGFGMPYDSGSVFYHRIATNPGTSTMLSDAADQNASFYLLQAGMADIYNSVLKGGTLPIPDVADFTANLDQILSTLSANGSKGAIANIPHFEDLPYFTTIPALGAELDINKADSLNDIYDLINVDTNYVNWVVGPNGFVIDDPLAPQGIRQLTGEENVCLIANLDSMRCFLVGLVFNTLPDSYVLDRDEIPGITATIDAYNAAIASKAAQYDIPVVDLNSYLASVNDGVQVNGVDFTSEFAAGGMFSLDGLHPTPRGSALIANQFIEAINAHYGSTIPQAQIADYNGVFFP